MLKILVPVISDNELMKRYEVIKPVTMVDGKLHYLRDFSFSELIDYSFIQNYAVDVREEVSKDELDNWQCKDFICLYGKFYGFDDLSVRDVLSQISDYDLKSVRAFEVVERLDVSEAKKNNSHSIALDNGYYLAIIRLYKEKK
ncbi:MAG: hypothetical protein HFJ55_04860 [Clostridia bacterium]|jgi:hypothetical protein|nr:hypothetical protein [Clostridia bacterium]